MPILLLTGARMCRPPPKGSALYHRLLALGRGAMAYGKFSIARQCFQAAGARLRTPLFFWLGWG